MGWTYGYSCSSMKNIDRFFDGMLAEDCRFVSKGYVVKSADRNIREYYRAFARPDGSVTALAAFVDIRDMYRQSEIGLRWDTESVGSLADHCPAAVLDLLTPTQHDRSVDWRERCRENLRKKKLVKPKQTRQTASLTIISLF